MNTADRILIEFGRIEQRRKAEGQPHELRIHVELPSGVLTSTDVSIVEHRGADGYVVFRKNPDLCEAQQELLYVATASIVVLRPRWI